MKVILLNNVPKLGNKFDIKTVSDGYARNFLFPRNLAQMATEKAIAAIELQKSLHDEKVKAENEALIKKLDKIKDIVISATGKANDKGHLFAGIHKEELAGLFLEQAKIEISPDHIVLENPIKETGMHNIDIKVGDYSVTCKVEIRADEEK